MVKITISMENAAFHDVGVKGQELARILRRAADDIEDSNLEHEFFRLRDTNGNTVGWLES